MTRAIAIATQKDYVEVHYQLGTYPRNRSFCKYPDTGVYTNSKWFHAYMNNIGYVWRPRRALIRDGQFPVPKGRIIAAMHRHYVAIIDGMIHDTHDPTFNGRRRRISGYWEPVGNKNAEK